jgi:hypothetical protein
MSEPKTPRDRPEWLVQMEPIAGEISLYWLLLVVHIARNANESGFFDPGEPLWLLWCGLTVERSYAMAERLEIVGAVTRHDGRWYVVGWRENYRVPD